jgi:hypothetical protein
MKVVNNCGSSIVNRWSKSFFFKAMEFYKKIDVSIYSVLGISPLSASLLQDKSVGQRHVIRIGTNISAHTSLDIRPTLCNLDTERYMYVVRHR